MKSKHEWALSAKMIEGTDRKIMAMILCGDRVIAPLMDLDTAAGIVLAHNEALNERSRYG